jgi:hypothetical protein
MAGTWIDSSLAALCDLAARRDAGQEEGAWEAVRLESSRAVAAWCGAGSTLEASRIPHMTLRSRGRASAGSQAARPEGAAHLRRVPLRSAASRFGLASTADFTPFVRGRGCHRRTRCVRPPASQAGLPTCRCRHRCCAAREQQEAFDRRCFVPRVRVGCGGSVCLVSPQTASWQTIIKTSLLHEKLPVAGMKQALCFESSCHPSRSWQMSHRAVMLKVEPPPRVKLTHGLGGQQRERGGVLVKLLRLLLSRCQTAGTYGILEARLRTSRGAGPQKQVPDDHHGQRPHC